MHDELLQTVIDNFGQLKRAMRLYVGQVAGQLGVSPSQLELLYALKMNQPVTSRQLADQLRLTPGAVSQLLDGLERDDHVMRSGSQQDRRIQYLALTPTGEALIRQYGAHRETLLRDAFAETTDNDLQSFLRVQAALIQQLQTILQGDSDV